MKYKNLNSAQKKRIFATISVYAVVWVVLLSLFASSLYNSKSHVHDSWDSYLHDTAEQTQLVQSLSTDATEISVGTYVENLREINIKSSYFRVEFMLWFNWEGDEELNPAENFRVYKGLTNKKVILDERHEGNSHYQLIGMDVSISKNFDTSRFPLDSQQMRIYVESTDPVQEVIFTPDYTNSGLNRNIAISGYEFLRHDIGAVSYSYDSTHGNPEIKDKEITSEIVTAFEINRKDFGLYFKCFVALIGTITWAFITLFICTYHHVDPLGMVPASLFGTVTNIMVGANLVPDALEIGLIEYVTVWGIVNILAVAFAIININRVRNKKNNDDEASGRLFAKYYGKILFYMILFMGISGQVILPLCAYAFN